MIGAAVETVGNRFALVLHTGGSPWETGYDVEISGIGDCAYVVHPGLREGRMPSHKFHFRLDAAHVERLVSVIREVGFFRLKELYAAPNAFNCRGRYVKVELDGESHVVNTRTPAPIEAVSTIIDTLNDILPGECPKIQEPA